MIELKEHNIKPYEALCRELEEHDKVAYVSATGTGKTYVGAKYIEEHGLIGSTLILVPSRVIRKNWKRIMPGIKVKSYQSLLTAIPDTSAYRLIICDEMHHLGAEKWGESFQQLLSGFRGKVLGMTATPVRFLDNGRNMVCELFEGNQVTGVDLPEAIEKGILPSFDYIAALYNLPTLHPKRRSSGREVTEHLYRQLDVMENEFSFQKILTKHMKPGIHKAAVFIPAISQIDEYMKVIQALYPDAVFAAVHSRMKTRDVKEELSRFEQSDKISFIFTVDLLNEGAHIDGVDTVIMFRKTESPNIFLQQLGRALTTDTAAERITVFDFVANHTNLRVRKDGAGSVIDWICDGITAPQRQIIKVDYAKTEREVLDKLNSLLYGVVWKEEEDQLIREHYGKAGAKEKLLELLPERAWQSIVQRASSLGLTRKYTKTTQEMREDIARLFLLEGGMKMIQDKYPELSKDVVYSIAKQLGLYQTRAPLAWTAEEDDIIRKNPGDIKVLEKMLPNRNVDQIRTRRIKLGLGKKRPVFTEEDRQNILNNQDLSTSELRRRFFPERCTGYVARKRAELNAEQNNLEPDWSKEKKKLFCKEYADGGSAAIMDIPEFKGMTRKQISSKARVLGVKTTKRSREGCVRFTKEEIAVLQEWALDGNVHSDEEIEGRFPLHTVGSVRQKMVKIRRKRREEMADA